MSLILRPWTPPASLTRLNTASIPALMLTPQLATAPVRSRPAPTVTSLSVTPSSARPAPGAPRTRRPARTASIARFTRRVMRLLPSARPGPWLSLSQIRAAHVVVARQLPAVAGQGNGPRLQDVPVVGDGERLVGVLLDEE